MNKIISITLIVLLASASCFATGMWQDFDGLPVTQGLDTPGNGAQWHYSSWKTNTYDDFYQSCGYWNTTAYSAHPDTYEYFKLSRNTENNEHMGYQIFAFMEVDDQVVVHGHSLRVTVTGGCKDDGNGGVETHGLELSTKEEYATYINNSQDPVDSSELVGYARIFMLNDSFNMEGYPLPTATGANRLSYYVFLPDDMTNYVSPNYYPIQTFNSAPFNGIGGHWYHDGYLNGGGWAHIIVDTHPQMNNSFDNVDDWPYPGYSVRAYDPAVYFNNMECLYLSIGMYSGTAFPKYYVYYDEIEFKNDPYYSSMNNETINSPSVMYNPTKESFNIGWSGKYKNNAYSSATYLLRYSYSQITNDNWGSAKPAQIKAYPNYNIAASTLGVVKKPSDLRLMVWCEFTLKDEDKAAFTPGTTIYFAMKDVSQDPNNLQVRNPTYNFGRNYADHMDDFDFIGDEDALPLIKHIDYYYPAGAASLGSPLGGNSQFHIGGNSTITFK